MFAYTLASKPCSEATNRLYLSSGVLPLAAWEISWKDLRKKNGDIEYPGK